MMIPNLNESESFVKGRSSEIAKTLIEAVGAENVVSTSHGYIVKGEFDAGDLEVYVAGDRPAVVTEPGTSTNPDEVHNVGQAPTATAERSDDKDVDPDVLAQLEAEKAAETSESTQGEEQKETGEQFDPASATIAEVKDYLDGADATERERVLAAEAASEKPRKGVLDLAEAPEGAK